MAKVFLDTNYFIDAIHRKPEKDILDSLQEFSVVLSTLSFHIYCYALKVKIPSKELNDQKDKFSFVNFSEEILDMALQGPTNDLEDNVQLHSAAEAEADYFLTSDKDLLQLKFFGKVKVVADLE